MNAPLPTLSRKGRGEIPAILRWPRPTESIHKGVSMVTTNGVGPGRQRNGTPTGADELNYGKRARWDASDVMNVPDSQRQWGYFPLSDEQKEVRRLVAPRPEEHPAERALANTTLVRLYDERFKTALIVHPSKATYASAAGAGAIILYLPGASCVHSQATAMLYQLGFFNNKGYPGVAIDHAFHGSGPREELFYSLTAYMSWIHSIVQYSHRLYAGVPVGIFGRSLGANVALEFAARYPGEAAFVIAMSGYNPQWTPFSIFEIDEMVKKGEFQVNEEGLHWTNALDPQWTWPLSRARSRIQQNNSLIMVGDRDTEYQWHPWQVDTVVNNSMAVVHDQLVIDGNVVEGKVVMDGVLRVDGEIIVDGKVVLNARVQVNDHDVVDGKDAFDAQVIMNGTMVREAKVAVEYEVREQVNGKVEVKKMIRLVSGKIVVDGTMANGKIVLDGRMENGRVMVGKKEKVIVGNVVVDGTVVDGKSVVAGNYALGFRVPPEGTPYHVKWWQKFAPTVGAELALFPGGEHNLFDGHNQPVVHRAEQSVLDFLGRTIPVAGRVYIVGRPYHFGDTVLELPAALDKLREQVVDMEKILLDHPDGVKGELLLAVLHMAMSRVEGLEDAMKMRYEARAASEYARAFPKIAGAARMLLLGRPIDDKMVQAAVRDALRTAHPFDLIPQTPSVGEFVKKVHGVDAKGVEGAPATLVHGTLYDFENRRLEVHAMIAEGALTTITLSGEGEALDTVMEHWQQNARLVTGKIAESHGAIELHEMRDEAGARYLALGRAEGRDVPDEVMLVRFMEGFFQYYPHPTVRDLVARVDAHEHWVDTDPAQVHLSQFSIKRQGDKMLVRTRPSDETDGTALSLVDLKHITEHQQRNPNGPAFRGRRGDASRPAGEFNVDHYPAANPLAPAPHMGGGFLPSLVGVLPAVKPVVAMKPS